MKKRNPYKEQGGGRDGRHDPKAVRAAYEKALQAIKSIDVEEAVAQAMRDEGEIERAYPEYFECFGVLRTRCAAGFYGLSARRLHALLKEFGLIRFDEKRRAYVLSPEMYEKTYVVPCPKLKGIAKNSELRVPRYRWTEMGDIFLECLLANVGLGEGRCRKWFDFLAGRAENPDASEKPDGRTIYDNCDNAAKNSEKMAKNTKALRARGSKRGNGAKSMPKEAFGEAIAALKSCDVNPFELRERAYFETEAVVAVLPPAITVAGEGLTTTQVAADFAVSARKLHEILNEFCLSFRDGETMTNHLVRTLLDRGYAEEYLFTKPAGRTPAVTQLRSKWTWKGRVFLALLLSKVGIAPFGRACPGWLGKAAENHDLPF